MAGEETLTEIAIAMADPIEETDQDELPGVTEWNVDLIEKGVTAWDPPGRELTQIKREIVQRGILGKEKGKGKGNLKELPLKAILDLGEGEMLEMVVPVLRKKHLALGQEIELSMNPHRTHHFQQRDLV